jgi:predicted dithiol-disulfide oxidoreductase (DUF899 family)
MENRMNPVSTREEWLKQRLHLLAEEKKLSKARDAVSALRRQMPLVPVDKDYVFTGASGKCSLAALFGDCSQLIIYHFMYGDDWDDACNSCSFTADNFDGIDAHLAARDAAFAVISAADYATLAAFKSRMSWRFNWLSSKGNSFNRDYGVNFAQTEIDEGAANYNFGTLSFPATEAPGISVFTKDTAGKIYHSYSTYARGLDMMIGAYHYLDLLPKGRDEDGLDFKMSWLRKRDSY